MPTVTYGPRKVVTAALPGVRKTAAETEASTGVGVDQARGAKWGAIAQVGHTVGELGRVIGQEAITAKAEAAQFAHDVALVEADNKIAAWELDKVHGPQGALSKQGKAAMGTPEAIGDAYTAFVGEIAQSLGTDRQRLDFAKLASNRQQAMDLTLRRHVNQEMTAYAAGELDASVKLAQNDAIANAQDPARVGRALDNAVGVIALLGPSTGMGPDAIKVAVAQTRSATHVGVIENLLATKQTMQARAYFAEAREQIHGAAIPKLEAMITAANVQTAGLHTAEDIWTKLGPKGESDPINLDTMETEARTRYADDPETLESTIRFLRERKAGVDAGRKDREEANTGALWVAVSKGASLADLSQSPAFLAAPGKLQAQLMDSIVSRAEHEANRRYADEGRAAAAESRAYTREQRADAAKEKAGWVRYWELSEPASLAKMTDAQINAQRGTLGDDHANRLLTQKRALGKSEDAVRAATIDDDLFKTTAQSAGIDAYSPKTDDQKTELGQLRNAVETAIDVAQQAKGKLLSRDEKATVMHTIIDRKVMLDRWLTDPEKVAATVVKPEDRAVAYVPIAKIPALPLGQYLNYVRGLTADTQRMTESELKARFGPRIQRAYALRLLGGVTTPQLEAILQGKEP